MVTGPDNSALQVFYGSLPLLGAILLASWREGKRFDDLNKRIEEIQTSLNHRIQDLQTSLNQRITDLRTDMTQGFKTLNDRIGKVEDRLIDVEKAQRLVQS